MKTQYILKRTLTILTLAGLVLLGAQNARAVDVVTNGTFDTDITTGWTDASVGTRGSTLYDDVNYGAGPGSFGITTDKRRNASFTGIISQSIGTVNATDNVTLSLYWRKYSESSQASLNTMIVRLIRPSGDSVDIWTNSSIPTANNTTTGNEISLPVSSSFNTTGSYTIRLVADLTTPNDNNAIAQANFDDVVIDVQAVTNQAPTLTAGTTSASLASLNRIGASTTQLSADFTDLDVPGAGSFTVTFRVREPDNATEQTIVFSSGHGQNGVTITDLLSGNYRATVDWDPPANAAIGAYDLFFDVSDGTDNAIDNYTDNLDELTVNSLSPPSFTANVTSVSPVTVNRVGTDSTRISSTWSDQDEQPVDSFWVIFSVQEPDNSTEVIIIDSLTHGFGGLTVIDNGDGTYTAYADWDPGAGQTLGLYDLRCRVFDGTIAMEDGYAANPDELTVEEVVANNPPTVTGGATVVSVSPVNRLGANTTTISTTFNDSDQPGVGAFTVTFKIREPNNSTELFLVNALTNGVGGLTITDNGGGSYTAAYAYDPADAQTLGLYDLYFEVSDGTDNAIDDYTGNLDELEINEVVANNAPIIISGATQATVSPVARQGAVTTTLFASFTDIDQPALGSFTVTLKVRQPDNSTEDIIANALTHGVGGLTITDNGGGSYTAQITWDPPVSQVLGLYDLYCEVSDGADNAIDNYANNLDELEVIDNVPNVAPIITEGAPTAAPLAVNRFGANTTNIYSTFHDDDLPGVGAFSVTFKIREPDDLTELTLVNNQPNGSGGVTITDLGSGNYRADYTYDPDAAQTIGLYDIYFSVSDGIDAAVDDYFNNLDEMDIFEAIANNPPVIIAGATVVSPSAVNRTGANPTTFSTTFTDTDAPGIAAFNVSFKVRLPFNASTLTLADSLADGVGGMSIVDNGGGSYTASFSWDPPDNSDLGNYDLYAAVDDGQDQGIDAYDSNPDELLISNGGENSPPVAPSDNTFASPAGVERIGANLTTIATTFSDADIPGVGAFTVTFKLREPDNTTEIVLANNLLNGQGGVSISDDGGGIYTASISWDPPDAQLLGLYDLYFHVTDGIDTSYDGFNNNLDELAVVDAISNNLPTLTAGATLVLPDTVNRIGAQFTTIKTAFSDADDPGRGAFTITIKVRDNTSTEYMLVNAAINGEQGLRIKHTSFGNYEASVLWDPPDAQVIGPYDLYFSVEDAAATPVIDDYASNTDELELTSAAILGDGFLLRRNNDAGTCGGPNSACHNLVAHMGLDCMTCHAPHQTTNIYLIRDTILTPFSGKREVIFKTLGIGDPYNDPDPTVGDPTSGVMADDADGVHTGVCEVCHRASELTRHSNDDTHTDQGHENATNCTACHPHSEGFPKPVGGAEGSGAAGCSCHSSFASPMNSSTTSYHHFISSENNTYDVAQKTCLMCHVNHDIFRPDLNPGFGQRAKNLRVDITTTPAQGNSTDLTNNDYLTTGTGGVCLSCHTSGQTKSFTPPDGTTSTVAISKTNFDAATLTHNYSVPSTFTDDGSTFNATCVKCHNDNRTKQYQNGTYKFTTHDSPIGKMLDSLGFATPADPIEENLCFGCHSQTQNPNAGSNLDYFGVQTMSDSAIRIATVLGYQFAHPVTDFSGRHKSVENGPDLADGSTRHAECMDCHDVHSADQGTHDGTSNLVSNPLKGVWGVEPTAWPVPSVPSNNGNVFTAPTGFTKVEPAQREYQICLKCHSNYTTLPLGKRNLAQEINPNYPSQHGIVQAGDNPFCNSTTMHEPWGTNKIAWCSDCHRSDVPSDPNGPHGSNQDHLLVATITSNSSAGTPLCFTCHRETVYWSDRNAGANSNYDKHPSIQGNHAVAPGCFACHMWDHSSTPGLGVSTSLWPNGGAGGTGGPPPIQVWVHGQNRRWVYNERDGSAGSGQYADAFLNGYLANIDTTDGTSTSCWAETCKDHAPQSY